VKGTALRFGKTFGEGNHQANRRPNPTFFSWAAEALTCESCTELHERVGKRWALHRRARALCEGTMPRDKIRLRETTANDTERPSPPIDSLGS
jgi:hypothetical protein